MERKIIDGHFHLAQWFCGDEDYVTALRKYKRECGICAVNAVCLPNVESLFPGCDEVQNTLAAILKAEDTAAYACGGLFYPEYPARSPHAIAYDFKAQAEEIKKIGFDGVKLIESKPNVRKLLQLPLDSPAYEEFFSYIEQEQMPLVWHVGDPADFWDESKTSDEAKARGWFYGDGTFPARDGLYTEVLNVLKRHPRLRVIFPHCFFMSREPKRLEALLNEYESVYIDLTPGPEMYVDFTNNYAVWCDMFNKYYRKILFGTDLRNDTPEKMRKMLVGETVRFLSTADCFSAFSYFGMNSTIHGLGLEKDKLECILHKNFTDIFGNRPKKIDKTALAAYIKRQLPHISAGRTKTEIVAYMNEKL